MGTHPTINRAVNHQRIRGMDLTNDVWPKNVRSYTTLRILEAVIINELGTTN
jgi:hypothetical protein